MKRIILIPVIALMMVACKKDDQQLAATDSTQATIEALKMQVEQQKIELAKQTAIDSMQMIAELKLPMEFAAAPLAERKVVHTRAPKRHRRAAAPVEAPVIQNTPVAQSPAPVDNSTIPATLPVEQKKKGWSNTAKGAVIGAGVGAIGGAVISKNHRVKGAVLGGLIGAAAGAGTGIILDKRKQRMQWQ